MRTSLLLSILLVASLAWAQATKKYPWQHGGTHCNETMTFCWYGAEDVSDPQATAYGNRWVSKDSAEKAFEWITEVRCLKDLKLCILARNQKVMNGSVTNIDLYRVEEWSSLQIRAIAENDLPHGSECEIDTLLLNRAEGSISMLSVPGPGASSKICLEMMKPKTVVYKLEVGLPKM